jgi:site-specific DNA-methyltransferase (adenine-specific)
MKLKWQTAQVKIKELKEYKDNPRRISDENLKKLAEHIKEDGYHQRLLVNKDNTIIGGHQRKKALLLSGYTEDDEIEVLKASAQLTQEQLDRLNIRDNLDFGRYDPLILFDRFEQEELLDFGIEENDLELLREELDLQIEDIDVSADEDTEDIVEVNEQTSVKLGDVYKLGEHYLICGDSTDSKYVSKLLDEYKPNLMVTDPPYGVEYDATLQNSIIKSRCNKSKKTTDVVLNDNVSDWTEAYKLFQGDVAYVWHAPTFSHEIAQHLISCDFKVVNLIAWNKSTWSMSKGNYHHKFESCYYVARDKKGVNRSWQGARDQSTVWDINSIVHATKEEKAEKTGHSTQKPLECMSRPIRNNSKRGDWIYDPFSGSGTTLMACQALDRKCITVELSTHYVDAIINRFETKTNIEAKLIKKIK